ncbi:MAG: carboxypeptidase-like regulatory domain-containing protein [Thermoproteota archaeon]
MTRRFYVLGLSLIVLLLTNVPLAHSTLWDLIIAVKPAKEVFQADEPLYISGNIVNHAQKPIVNAEVKIRLGSDSIVTTTDSEGKFYHEFGVKDRIPGKYIVNVAATSEDEKIGLASTTFIIKGTALASAQLAQSFDDVYSLPDKDIDFENDPITALIYKYRQDIAAKLEKEKIKQEKLGEYQKFLDEQRKIAEMRLEERIVEEKPGGGNYVGSWQYDRFVATLDGPAKDVILRQLNYTNKMWEEAKISMHQVLENGGTWQDAMQVFVDGAALSREQMESLTKITNSTDTTADQVNGTLPYDLLDSTKNENVTKEKSLQFDVNGTAIKTGLKGTIIRLNVNGTIIELLVNGTTITPITNSTKN